MHIHGGIPEVSGLGPNPDIPSASALRARRAKDMRRRLAAAGQDGPDDLSPEEMEMLDRWSSTRRRPPLDPGSDFDLY